MLSCSLQTLVAGVTLSNYDLGQVGGPLPRGDPPALIPFCLQFFNFATLDDFASFVDDEFRNDGPFTNDFVLGAINTTDASDGTNSDTSSDSGSGTGAGAGGGAGKRSANTGVRAANQQGATEASKRPFGAVQIKPRSADPKQEARNMARTANENGKTDESPSQSMVDFGKLVNATIAEGPAAAQLFFLTPEGQALLERATTGPFADLIDGSVKQLAGAAAKLVTDMLKPGQELVKAASNLTGTIAANSTNLLTKALVNVLEVGEPLVKLGAEMQKNITQAIKSNSDKMKDKATNAYEQLSKEVEAMPEGPSKEQLKAALQQQADKLAKAGQDVIVKKAEGEAQLG